jgi:hypothetical protein
VAAAGASQLARSRAAAGAGAAGTILTTPQGLTEPATTQQKTLLGSTVLICAILLSQMGIV